MGCHAFGDEVEGDQYFLGIVRFKVGSAEPHPPVGSKCGLLPSRWECADLGAAAELDV
jgi:hypothetical protein